MAIHTTTSEDVKAYHKSGRASQSKLKNIIEGRDHFLKKEDQPQVEKEYFLIGGGVDCILTGAEGDFEREYYVSALEKKPSEVEMQMTKHLFEEVLSEIGQVEDYDPIEDMGPLENYYDLILQTTVDFGWQKRWKDDTKFNSIVKSCSEYFEDLKDSYGKTILSTEQHNKIQQICTSLRNNENTQQYFNRELLKQQPGIDVYYQLPIFFEIKGVKAKALLDIVVVGKDQAGNPSWILPIDLKTMAGDTIKFLQKIKQHRYDIQAAWYTEALKHWMPGVPVKNFRFIVETTTNPSKPLCYEIDDEMLSIGKLGLEPLKKDNRIISYGVRGYQSLLDEYIYFVETEFRLDKDMEKMSKNGILTLGWSGIKWK